MLKKALTTLSNSLDVLYDDALLRIESQHQNDRELAERALCWVAYSFRPLSAGALLQALAIEPEETVFDVEAIPRIALVLDVCAGLLIHDKENGVVRLVHYTAQNYFERLQNSRFREYHATIAKDCMTYLNYDCFKSSEDSEESSDEEMKERNVDSNDNEKRKHTQKLNETWRDPEIFFYWSTRPTSGRDTRW